MLVGLDRHAVPGPATGVHERICDARRFARELVVMDHAVAGQEDARSFASARKMRLEERVEIRVHEDVTYEAYEATRGAAFRGIIPHQ